MVVDNGILHSRFPGKLQTILPISGAREKVGKSAYTGTKFCATSGRYSRNGRGMCDLIFVFILCIKFCVLRDLSYMKGRIYNRSGTSLLSFPKQGFCSHENTQLLSATTARRGSLRPKKPVCKCWMRIRQISDVGFVF